MKKNAEAGFRFALKKVDALIGASRGEETSCAVFGMPSWGEDAGFTEEQKRAVRVYVDSWIREPLAAAIASATGDRSYAVESYLDSLH